MNYTITKKNIIIMHPTDKGACSWYRMRFMADLINSGRCGEAEVIVSPVKITDKDVLRHTAAVIVARPILPEHFALVEYYKHMRANCGFKVYADYDDLVWDVNGAQTIPDYNPAPIDTIQVGKEIENHLGNIDGIIVSTKFLKGTIKLRFDWDNVIVLPNAVPRFAFGKARKSISKNIVKPKVLYAGSLCHSKDGDLGDFSGVWIPWLKESLANDEIEFHCFGEGGKLPDAFKEIAEKTVFHEYVSSLEFPSTIASIKPDFYIAPLRPNAFNMAKSNLKLLEATACGAVLLPSIFKGSPYLESHMATAVRQDTTVTQMREKIKTLCEFDVYNDVLDHQNVAMDYMGYWMDSDHYIERYLRIFFGNTLLKNL